MRNAKGRPAPGRKRRRGTTGAALAPGRQHHQIAVISLTKLNPATYNPRIISPEALDGLTASIEKFGLVEPIIWNKQSGNVVGGHQRLEVLRKRGEQDAQVVVVDLPLREEKELNIALNNLSGEWNYDALKNLLTELNPNDETQALLGFSDQEFTALLKWGEDAGAAPDAGVGLTPDERLEVFENNTIKQIVLYLKTEDYIRVLKRMAQIAEKLKLDSNSEVFMHVLDKYDE